MAMMEGVNVKDLAAVILAGCDSPALVNGIVAQQSFGIRAIPKRLGTGSFKVGSTGASSSA